MASPRTRACASSRSMQVAVLWLRRALEKANASLTVQEGLYRAYTTHLCDLDPIDDIPDSLREAIHEFVVDLRRAFGFDEATGAKIAPSTLGRRQAALLLARLGTITSGAEALADGAETERLR